MKPIALTILFVALLACSVAAQAPGVRLVPFAKGWAKTQINTVIFRKNSLATHKNYQYAAYYDEASGVVLARRRLGSRKWEVGESGFSGHPADAHNSISIAVDGAGYLHMAWDNHNTPLKYSRSANPGSLEMKDPKPMIGDREDKATYPEFYNLPDGDLLFFYRDGASGNGNLVLNRYDVRSQKWTRVQDNLIDGQGNRNAYPQIAVDAKGTIHISWVWRETPNVATNHDLCYARSKDGGKTWTRSTGDKYQLPINAVTAEYIWYIQQGSELINQTSMTTDIYGNPYISTYWRPARTQVPQYQLVYFDGKTWKTSQISNRTTPFTLSGGGTKRIPVSRPQIVIDKKTVFVIFRDAERGNKVSVAFTDDPAKSDWQVKDLTREDVGMWEPTLDRALWDRRKELHLFVQKVGQGDGEGLEHLAPQMISVLEWKP
jgi:hypothetical protein